MDEQYQIIYQQAKNFKKKYHLSIAWRIKHHCKVIAKHLNPGEEVLYTFCAQRNDISWNFINTCVVCLTSRRIIIGKKDYCLDIT